MRIECVLFNLHMHVNKYTLYVYITIYALRLNINEAYWMCVVYKKCIALYISRCTLQCKGNVCVFNEYIKIHI